MPVEFNPPFGQWLKQRRKSLGLTQVELARRANYSAIAIRKLEANTLPPSPQLVESLAGPLKILPEERDAFREFALSTRAQANASRHPAPNNLPVPLTPFIGRELQVAELVERVQASRLVTLTGAGGVGKTRLALEVGAAVLTAPAFTGGIRLVELAPVSDPALVPLVVARAFRLNEETNMEPATALAAFLAQRRVLLVLDNCEHLISACAELVEALLRACPGLCVLATSREPLRVPGEVAWRVPPMDTNEAARLFENHAQSARPGFEVTERNAAAIHAICQRLDGIPLAIELAAAQVRVLPVAQIAARLTDRLRLLEGGARTALPRQQTLRATIDWSYTLLSPTEQALFIRLAVFAGGCTLEAAEAVCGDQAQGHDALPSATNPTIPFQDVLGLLTSLVDKSMVVAENREGTMRYGLLETLRQYAQERLSEAGQARALRDRHLAYYLAFTEKAAATYVVSKLQPWKLSFQAEFDNLRTAQAWCRVNAAAPTHAEAWLRISVVLAILWVDIGYSRDAMQWLQWLWESAAWQRATAQTTDLSTTLQAQALYLLWALPIYTNSAVRQPDELAEPAVACLARCRAAGDQWGAGYAHLSIAMLAERDHDYARARALVLDSLRVFEEHQDTLGLSCLFTHLINIYRALNADMELVGILARNLQWSREWESGWYPGVVLTALASQMLWLGESARAAALAEQLLTVSEAWDDLRGVSVALHCLDVADPPRALVLAEQNLKRQRLAGDEEGIAFALHRLGSILIDCGKYQQARPVLDECVARFRDIGDVPSWVGLERALYTQAIGARYLGEYQQALASFDECDRLRGEWLSSQAWLGVGVPFHRGLTLLDMGNVEAAVIAFKASLKVSRKVPDAREFPPLLLAALSEVMWALGKPRPAMRLAGSAAAFAREERFNNPSERIRYERALDTARAQLGDTALTAAWAEGQRMTLDAAVTYALQVSDVDETPA